ncbi:hypothetical protein IW140_001777 [Coemansia sp. RSA 1813]|nr:hypothetical protein EV178_002592 [Coemansia sp. RSA 1646]KAJ1769671.1 hypothetical protein LPJ74_003823 [Coemansia sp. RSA 1843]KAJ2091200.1 hypothetical protein IW138_002163 [Coemansia sp. RSA 986]KAJ2211636.1 hypothetical protein EV179_005308 [Coemansia sp. RSA 487]KAJ2571075.1 hypothetical protein IW140_001777 [Coemansia sp. RSA 1813]
MLPTEPIQLLVCAFLLACVCKAAETSGLVAVSLPSGGIYSLMDLHKQPGDGLDNKATSGISGNRTHRCFPLRRSKYCGAGFENYYMSMLVTVGGRHVSNADELDSVMDTYFDSPEEQRYINSFFGCQAWPGWPTPRFRIAYTCRSLLESHEAIVCNRHHRPPSLCADACKAYIDEWAMLTQNTSMCTNVTIAEQRRESLAESCSVWPYNGTKAMGCISSTESGAEICGFPVSQMAAESTLAHDTSRLCGFCKNTNDSCCRGAFVADKCRQKGAQKRTVFYLALTVSMSVVLALLIIAAAAGWYMRSMRKARESLLADNGNNSDPSTTSLKGIDSAKGSSRDTAQRTTSLVIDNAIKKFYGGSMSPAGSSLSGKFCQDTHPKPRETEVAEETQSARSSPAQSSFQQRLESVKQTSFQQITSYLCAGAAQLLRKPLGLYRFRANRLNTGLHACEITNDRQCSEKPESIVGVETPSPAVCASKIQHNGATDDGIATSSQGFKARDQSLRGHSKHIGADVKQGNEIEDDASSSISSNELFTVLYPYSPVEDDELLISPGEQVHVLRLFSDGWVFIRRENDGEIGAVPAVCLDTSVACIMECKNVVYSGN